MQVWKSLRRATEVGWVLARHFLAYSVFAWMARWPVVGPTIARRTLSPPDRLRGFFEDLGGAFLKLGQLLALQPDLLSVEYCNALFDLLDRVSPVAWEDVEKVVREELGRSPDEIFDEIDHTPLATASIGQVHVAWVGGRKVAVKIQRGTVDRDFGGDIRVMLSFIRFIRFFRLRSLMWLIGPIEEFIGWTSEELDYRSEARFLERARANAHGRKYEYVPECFAEFTRRRILVVEFCEGYTVLEYLRAREGGNSEVLARIQATGFDAQTFASHIVENFLSGAFGHGLFHSDLHPANLLILPDNVVGYIDFGITGVLSRYARKNMAALSIAWMRADLDLISNGFAAISRVDENSDVDAYRRGLDELGAKWYDLTGPRPKFIRSFTMVMLDMLILARQTGVLPDPDITKYVRSTTATDGLMARLAPGFDLGLQLEKSSERYIEGQTRKELFSFERWMAWTIAGNRFVRGGPARIAAVIDRFNKVGSTVRARLETMATPNGPDLRLRAIRSAAVAGMVGYLVAQESRPFSFGLNLLTIEVVIATFAAFVFLRTIRRLA